MFGSYGSYSSMCATSAPMDITSRSSLSAHDATCAFPSWPRRSSLSESDREERPNCFFSDEELSFDNNAFDDDARSVSSSSSAGSPNAMLTPPITDAELLEMQRERLAMRQEFVRCVMSEKERRRAAARKQRKSSSSSSSKKSPKSKSSAMAPISEE